VSGIAQGIGDGFQLVIHGDREVVQLTLRSLRYAIESTAIAAVIGLPLGALLGLGSFRGRRALLAIANAGLRFPPVAIGWLLWVLLWPDSLWGGGPLSGLGWIYTTKAAILAQTLLALPIVIALTATAVQSVPGGLLAQARAFGASPWAGAVLALREARLSVLAALIASLGVTISTIGAILIVGGPEGTRALAPAVLVEWNAGGAPPKAVAYSVVLVGVFVVLAAALTWLQQRAARRSVGAMRGVRVS
jgi:tungstate transport system permease protein